MRTEQELNKIEEEIRAIKASFQQSATMLDVDKTTITFSTSPNIVRWNDNGNWEPYKYELLDTLREFSSDLQGNHAGYGLERVVVTFDCDGRQNTFASLEMDLIDANDWAVWQKRVPYSGGARWIVMFHVNGSLDGQGNFQWKPTIVKFAVESAIPGTLGAKMVWE